MMQNELAAIVGKEWVREGDASPEYAVDGVRPQLIVWPGTVEEVAAVLRRAHEAGWAVVPAGYGTGLSLGNPPERVDLVISTTRLNQILDYEPADLTASVQAGCSLGQFNQTVGEHGQWLPLDPPQPDRATLGAIAAVADDGPLRLGFGLPRDYVIGLQVVQADGCPLKTGGRVVKNVAGYDLNKLFVGSFGTLGIITQVNLKVRPRPETQATCLISSGQVTALSELVQAVAASELSPAAVEWLSPRAAQQLRVPGPAHEIALLVRFMDSQPSVQYQVRRLEDIARAHNLRAELLNEPASEQLWRLVRDFSVRPEANFTVRVSVRPADAARALGLLQEPLSNLTEDLGLVAHYRSGVVLAQGRFDAPDSHCTKLAERLRQLRFQCWQMNGSLIIQRAPVALKKGIDVWGEVGPTAEMMRALKRQFDPNRMLNPGRFVAGI